MSFDNAIHLNESMLAKMLLQLEVIPENSKSIIFVSILPHKTGVAPKRVNNQQTPTDGKREMQ